MISLKRSWDPVQVVKKEVGRRIRWLYYVACSTTLMNNDGRCLLNKKGEERKRSAEAVLAHFWEVLGDDS